MAKDFTNEIYATKSKGYLSFRSTVILSLLTLTSGIIYLIFQWSTTGELEDTYFVSMLIGATLILLLGIRYLGDFLLNKGKDFYDFILSTDDPQQVYKEYNEFFLKVMNFRNMTLVGLFYGLAIGTAPFSLGVWSDNFLLRVLLSVFLFFVNFVTGISFYSLISFFYNSVRLGKMIRVDLWQIENPSTIFLLGATRRIAILASIYIAISLTSVLFSKLPIDSLVILYSIFSGCVILSSLVVPSYPIMQKLKRAKIKNLMEIDKKLNEIFYKAIDDIKNEEKTVDLEKFDTLLQLRWSISNISIFPFRAKSISAGISVTVLSSLPIFVQVLLEVLF